MLVLLPLLKLSIVKLKLRKVWKSPMCHRFNLASHGGGDCIGGLLDFISIPIISTLGTTTDPGVQCWTRR